MQSSFLNFLKELKKINPHQELITKYILECDLNYRWKKALTPLMFAIIHQSPLTDDNWKKLISYSNVNIKDCNGKVALFLYFENKKPFLSSENLDILIQKTQFKNVFKNHFSLLEKIIHPKKNAWLNEKQIDFILSHHQWDEFILLPILKQENSLKHWWLEKLIQHGFDFQKSIFNDEIKSLFFSSPNQDFYRQLFCNQTIILSDEIKNILISNNDQETIQYVQIHFQHQSLQKNISIHESKKIIQKI
jgi:hypothetical protein